METEPGIGAGDVLKEALRLYRQNFGILIAAAFWLSAAIALFGVVTGTRGLLGFLSLLAVAVGTVYQGVVVCLVQNLRTGPRDTSVWRLFVAVAPAALTLLFAGFGATVLEGVGLSLFLLPGLLLITVWALIAPVIVVEETGVIDGFRRSQQLVRGFLWPVFVSVIVATLISVGATIGSIKLAQMTSAGPVLLALLGTFAATVTAAIPGLVAAVLYYRLLAIKGPAPPRIELPPPGPVV